MFKMNRIRSPSPQSYR